MGKADPMLAAACQLLDVDTREVLDDVAGWAGLEPWQLLDPVMCDRAVADLKADLRARGIDPDTAGG